MSRSSPLKVSIEIAFSAVTCPGLRLDPTKWVKLRLCVLGFHLSTRALRAHLPLEFNEKMLIERTFPLCLTPMHLFSTLAGEKIIVELVEVNQEARVLAEFSNDIIDILFGSPPIMRVNETRNHYLTIVLCSTHHKLGHMNFHLDATIGVTLLQVTEAIASCSHDEAINLTLGLYATEHSNYLVPFKNPLDKWHISPHACQRDYPSKNCQRIAIASRKSPGVSPKRKPFVVRHVDEKLIGRTPSLHDDGGIHVLDRGYTLGRTVKPWDGSTHRTTSQMDTNSSLLRRNARILKPVTRLVFPEEFESNWCSESDHPGRVRFTGETRYHHKNVDSEQEQDICNCLYPGNRRSSNDENRIPDFDCLCRTHHDSQFCTVCQLYKKYFGQTYPRHSV